MEDGGGGFRPGKKSADKSSEVDYKTKAGTAWSHSFLNQKPWHPLSYPNQRRKWIAEQTHSQRQNRAEEVAREVTTVFFEVPFHFMLYCWNWGFFLNWGRFWDLEIGTADSDALFDTGSAALVMVVFAFVLAAKISKINSSVYSSFNSVSSYIFHSISIASYFFFFFRSDSIGTYHLLKLIYPKCLQILMLFDTYCSFFVVPVCTRAGFSSADCTSLKERKRKGNS